MDDDNGFNNSRSPTFQEVVEARVTRRSFLGGGLATAATPSLGGIEALLRAVPASAQNRARGTEPPSVNLPDGSTVAGSARPPVDTINPRINNVYGHIITWKYRFDWTEPTFEWEIFALCGDPAVPEHGSTVVVDKFGSFDGIYVDPAGRLWVQTDCRLRR
jgi:secreted PhoX family phosphatase